MRACLPPGAAAGGDANVPRNAALAIFEGCKAGIDLWRPPPPRS